MPPAFRIETMLSLGDSTFDAGRRCPLQKVVFSALIAHCTAPSKTGRGN